MALPWNDVVSNPDFKALPPDQKDVARYQYFNQVIAPQVPQEDLHNAWQQFADYSRPNVVEDVQQSFVRGVGKGLEDIPTWAADFGNTVALGEKKAYEYYRDISGNPLTQAQEQAMEAKQPFYSSEETQDYLGVPRVTTQPSTQQGETAQGIGELGSGFAMPFFGKGVNALLKSSGQNAAQTASDIAASKENLLPQTRDAFIAKGLSPEELDAMTPEQITGAKNNMYAQGIAGNISGARNIKNSIYSMADEVGNDDVYNGASVKSQLDNLHEQYRSDPAYDGTPLVRKLDSWRDMFGEDGSITPTRLNKLMDQVEDAYRENPKSPEGEVYNAIKSPLSSALSDAKGQFPNWGKLIDTADDAHYNLTKFTQDDGTFTGKWSPESQKDLQIVAGKSGNMADLMGDTQKQISSLANVKDEAELQKLMAFIPEDMQGQFLADVQKNSSTPLKVKNLVKSILYAAKGNPGWSFTNALQSLPTKIDMTGWDADAATHITDRMQSYKDIADEAYQAHINKMNADAARQSYMSAQGAKAAASAQKALPAPTIPALPAPQTPFKSDWSGNVSPMSPEDIARAQASREAWPSVAPGEAQPASARGDIREPMTGTGQWQRDFMRENRGRPLSSTIGQEYTSPAEEQAKDTLKQMSDPEYDMFLKNKGYKRGGAIPSEAQKHAGNYKKDHIRLHGLDIAIENKKGSIRSGKDKDGKEWSVRMPASYGYIKRTTGADGDHVDCYIGPHEESNRVYIIDQVHHDTRKWDEHKCMIGFESRDEAINTYKAGFSDNKGHKRIGKVTRMSMNEFKNWLRNGNTKKPIKEAA